MAGGLPAKARMSMEELLARRCVLNAEVGATCRDLQKARRRVRGSLGGGAGAWTLTERLRRIVLILYMLAEYRPAPAIHFLVAEGRKRRWPNRAEDELIELVENQFLEVDVCQLTSLCDVAAPADAGAMRAAVAILEEWRLAQWVVGLNREKGVAPSTQSVLQRCEEGRLRWPADVRPPSNATAAEGKGKEWARRWRSRWGLRHAALRVRDTMSPEEMREKVRHFSDHCAWKPVRKAVPDSGP